MNDGRPDAGLHPGNDELNDRAFGFWVYLMSDAVIFALLFATFAVMLHGDVVPNRAGLFDLRRAFIETMTLLASSVAFGIAYANVREGRRRGALIWLAITFLLGASFVGLEISEFARMIAESHGPQQNGFLSAFFTLVGTHGLHVSAGLFWIAVLGLDLAVRGTSPAAASRLLRLGLFWHFLDIVWIGIFSVVYLPAFVR